MLLFLRPSVLYQLLLHGILSAARSVKRFFIVVKAVPAAPPRLPSGACQHISGSSLISVIIPSFNEGEKVIKTIESARADASGNVEVIVADGGSSDETKAAAAKAGAKVIEAPTGRAACMNAGARVANGDILIFLHSDTCLPDDWAASVRHCLRRPEVALAAFTLSFAPQIFGLSVIEWFANRRARFRSLPWGDQVYCVRREVFEALGGYPDQPLLEDVEFVCAARRAGEVVLFRSIVVTSSRRWQVHGVVANTLNNQIILLARELGVPVHRMADWYYGRRPGKRTH